MSNDGIKWTPVIEVIKYEPQTVREITQFLDSHHLRAPHRFGREATGPELRMLEREYGLTPDEVVTDRGNILVINGLGRLTSLITGSGTGITSTLGLLGVGATNTAAAPANTALAANGGSALYKALDGAPSISTTTTTNDSVNVAATFTTAQANFAWEEWCVGSVASGTVTANATLASVGTSPIMWNRKVASLGTKASGAEWTLNAKITLA